MGTEHTEERPAPLRGYRVLSDEQKAAVDEIKRLEAKAGELWDRIKAMPGTDPRALAVARTELQTAFMWFVRGLTRPLDVFEEVQRGE